MIRPRLPDRSALGHKLLAALAEERRAITTLGAARRAIFECLVVARATGIPWYSLARLADPTLDHGHRVQLGRKLRQRWSTARRRGVDSVDAIRPTERCATSPASPPSTAKEATMSDKSERIIRRRVTEEEWYEDQAPPAPDLGEPREDLGGGGFVEHDLCEVEEPEPERRPHAPR